MFFNINEEKKIGFKRLSNADLGLGGTSHQTHIGLYEKMLDFLDDSDTTTAILIYEDYCDILNCDFDRIENPDGTFRSPKIRKGTDGKNTIVKQIRRFANDNPNREYYLVWFGLDNNELLFWLIDNTSNDYLQISKFMPKVNRVYEESQINFTLLLKFIEAKVNKVTIDIQQELEITAQLGTTTFNTLNRTYKPIDIEKAQRRFKETGRKGEELVNMYLEKIRLQNRIHSFQWENKDRESGKPFDFTVNPGRPDENYIDVKSTLYKFEQPLVFSNGEIHFIKSIADEKYSVYRIYELDNLHSKLKICQKCLNYMITINNDIVNFQNNLELVAARAQEIKIAFKPNIISFGKIHEAITL